MSQRVGRLENAPDQRVPRTAVFWWGAVALVVLIGLVFARTVEFGFTDDDYVLARSWSVHDVFGSLHGPFDQVGYLDPYFRPMASVLFALEWHVWGTNRWGYHLDNLVLHAGATLALWSVLSRVRVAWWAGLIGAAFFALVPSNAAAAVYVAERTDAMVAVCICLGLVCLWRWDGSGETRWLVGLGMLYVVALLSKEVAVATVPFVAIGWMYLQVERHDPLATSGRYRGLASHWSNELRIFRRALLDRPGRWRLVLGPLVVLTAVYLAYRTAVMPGGSFGGRYAETQDPVRALLGGLNSTVKGVPWEIRPLPWVAVVTALVGAAVIRPRSRSWRVVLFGAGGMISGVLPLTFSGGVEPRLLYVAEIGLAIVIAGIASIYGEAITSSRRRERAWTIATAGTIAILLGSTVVVSQFRAQDMFAPGSRRQLDGALRVWKHPAADRVAADHLRYIEQQLRGAGMIDADGNPTAVGG